jgi:tripartite-type tricarboxylate transporter receptor subunit TctC
MNDIEPKEATPMHLHRRTFLNIGAGLTAAAALGFAMAISAQTFPDRPITLVVPFPPGGNNDVVARTISEPMSKILGQPVVVENRAGGGGAIGTTYVATAKPDGLTLLIAPPGQIATLPQMLNVGYTIKSFKPVGFANKTSMVLVSRKDDKRFKNLAEFIAYARANPGKLNVAHGGPGTPNHLAALQLEQVAGVQFNIIPYKGSAPMIQDLLGAQIDAIMDQVTSSRPHFETALQPIAVIGTRPDAGLPGVPTIGSLGLKEFDSTTYVGMLAPAGTPDATVAILAAALKKALEAPNVVSTFTKVGSAPYPGDAKEFAENMQRENDLAIAMVKAGKLKSD